jgi:type 1 glutamine amidotransferase
MDLFGTTAAMKSLRFAVVLGLLACLLAPGVLNAADSGGKTHVLVVTGGHDFEKEPFFKMFKDNANITFKAAEHPNAHALLRPDAAKEYDVLVLYDMHQPISEEAKADFVARLKEGKGLVVLHHAIANYQKWPEYAKIIGARYYLEKTVVAGVEKARSLWQHDVKFKLQVAAPNHPVTKGLQDFQIHDETYKLFDVLDGCQTLLTTDEPLSNKVVAWAKTYEGARVVYIQLGHDHFAYENPSYRQLLDQAIQWTAKEN